MKYNFSEEEIDLIKKIITNYLQEEGEKVPSLNKLIKDIEMGRLAKTRYVFSVFDSLGLYPHREFGGNLEKLYQDAARAFFEEIKSC